MGMGPRMREDTDYEWGAFLLNLLGLIMALLCLGERGRDGDGSPHARGHGLRMGGVSPKFIGVDYGLVVPR